MSKGKFSQREKDAAMIDHLHKVCNAQRSEIKMLMTTCDGYRRQLKIWRELYESTKTSQRVAENN